MDEIELKCDSCRFQCGDYEDGYGWVVHCSRGHWAGRFGTEDLKEDPWADCKDYLEGQANPSESK